MNAVLEIIKPDFGENNSRKSGCFFDVIVIIVIIVKKLISADQIIHIIFTCGLSRNKSCSLNGTFGKHIS